MENVLERERERERERELTNQFFIILNEAAQIVGVDLYSLEKKKLGEMAQCCDGIHQTPKYADSGVPFISVKNIKNIYETQQYISKKDFKEFKFKPEKGDVFMTRIGDIGTCAVVQNDEDLAYYVTLTLIKPNRNIILGGFIKYFIESDYGRKELDKRTLHKAIPIKINLGDVKQLELPLPPLSVQEHVVSILDKFSEIANDLEQGLPAEINLRQKQYEYYRNLLLSFPNQN